MTNMLERAAWTFVQGFLGVFLISDLSTGRGALSAGVASALSVVKTYAQGRIAKWMCRTSVPNGETSWHRPASN